MLILPFNEHVSHEKTGFLNFHTQKGEYLSFPLYPISIVHSTYIPVTSCPLDLKHTQLQPFAEADLRNFLPFPCLVPCNKALFLYHKTSISGGLTKHWWPRRDTKSCLDTCLWFAAPCLPRILWRGPAAAWTIDPGRCLGIPSWWDDASVPHFSFIFVVEKQDLIWKKSVVEYFTCDSTGQVLLFSLILF